ncbi:DUF4386 family protein [Clostridium neuense]|uniref:DUF4386 family protein n=1 Tax=Clostridium neuense TaxID=1728934 RepID=A0ABW8TBA9_9CLOT
MNLITFYKLSGIFIILVGIGFAISNIGIAKLFNYPSILREPVDSILNKYQSCGKPLKFFWMLFVLSSLMLIPTSTIFYKILNTNKTPYLIIGTSFGITAGIFYCLGLMRWVFLADTLSKAYIRENTDSKTKDTIALIFNSFHVYTGNSIGETMGFLCMGLWISILGISIISNSIFPSVIGIIFIISGIGVASGPLEWIGFKYVNKINKISIKIWAVSLLVCGIILVK